MKENMKLFMQNTTSTFTFPQDLLILLLSNYYELKNLDGKEVRITIEFKEKLSKGDLI